MGPLRAVLFDLDGVLVDSYRLWFQLLNATAHDLGYPEISAEAFHECWGQGVEADCERFFPRHAISEIEGYYDAHYADHLAHLSADPETPAVFRALAAAGIGSAVVTNTPNPLATRIVREAGATPTVVVGGNDVPRAKPAPDMVLSACMQLGVDVADAVVVGDSAYDRDAAEAAGVRFLGVGIDGDARVERLDELLFVLRVREPEAP